MKQVILLLAAFYLLPVGSAQADIIFDVFIRAPGLSDGLDNTQNVAAGAFFDDAQVILRETVDGSASVLAASNLNAYITNVSSSGSDGSFSDLTLDTTGGAASGANGASTLSFFALGAIFGQPGKAPTGSGSIREILLGTVDLQAPTSGSTTFQLSDFNPALTGDFVTFANDDLEAIGATGSNEFNYRSLTLTAVPEPSSLAICGVAVIIAGMQRRRKLT